MTRQELHLEMVRIVDQIVEHYESDFYDYDVGALDKAKDLNHSRFLWIPRMNGTFLLAIDNEVGMENWFDAILQNFRSELTMYYITRCGNEWDIAPYNEKKARMAFSWVPHFDIEVTDDWGNQLYKDVGLFCTKALAEEKAQAIAEHRGGKFWYVTPRC